MIQMIFCFVQNFFPTMFIVFLLKLDCRWKSNSNFSHRIWMWDRHQKFDHSTRRRHFLSIFAFICSISRINMKSYKEVSNFKFILHQRSNSRDRHSFLDFFLNFKPKSQYLLICVCSKNVVFASSTDLTIEMKNQVRLYLRIGCIAHERFSSQIFDASMFRRFYGMESLGEVGKSTKPVDEIHYRALIVIGNW